MTVKDANFHQQRQETFNKVLALIEKRMTSATPIVVLHLQEMSPDTLRSNAERDVWSLFRSGIRHLKDGAPDHQPGSLNEALSRSSLRASPFAAALGIKTPQFEPVYFSVDYTTGAEAALFACERLIDMSGADFAKSRQAIQQKILAEKAVAEDVKKQMALSFNVLADTYGRVCGDLKKALAGL